MSDKERQFRYRNGSSWLRHTMSGALFNSRRKAAAKGIPFSIDFAYVRGLAEASGGLCAISGLPFQKSGIPGHKGPYSPSLDRIRPSEGYVPGNVRIILDALNSAKSTGTDEDLIAICRAVAENNQ